MGRRAPRVLRFPRATRPLPGGCAGPGAGRARERDCGLAGALARRARRDGAPRQPRHHRSGSERQCPTGVLELARGCGPQHRPDRARPAGPTHTIVLVSSDGGAYGGLGAVRFLETSPYRRRISAAVNLVAIGETTVCASRSRRIGPVRRMQRWSRPQRRSSNARARNRDERARGPVDRPGVPVQLLRAGAVIGATIPALSLTTADCGRRRPRRTRSKR